jgi:ubiquinone biosynthesis protein
MIRIIKFVKLFKLIYGKNPKPDLNEFQKLGLLAVKIGQMYALRSDFLNEEKCEHLRKLYRLNTPVSSGKIKERFEALANDDLLENLEWFDDEPLATASVGQVHKARLKDGNEVVIKITKQDFEEEFEKDVNSFRALFKFVIFFYPKLARVADPIGVLNTVERTTLDELDLNKEIEGQEIVKEIKSEYEGKFDLESLKLPKIYNRFSGENILVMEYLDFSTFDELIDEKKLDYNQVLKLFKIHGAMMFVAKRFHGDLHPGNIFAKDRDLYFIDISTIEKVDEEIGNGLLNFFLALAKNNYEKCADAISDMSSKKLSEDKFKKYKREMLKLYDGFAGKTVTEVSLTTQMMRTVKLAVNSGMEFPQGVFAIIKSLMYLDGMVIKAAPETVLADMLEDLGVYTEDILKLS